jgi:hypothetical protein
MKGYLPIDFRAGFAAAAIFAAACAAHAQPSGTGEAARPGGKFTTFDVSGAMGTYPAGMNDSGTIAGEYTSAVNVFHGFVRASDGTITTFDVSGAATTRAGGINDAGTIVGSYTDNNGNSHGFVRTADGNITTFDVPNATATQPSGINKKGVITGNYTDSAGGVHGFILNLDGSFTVFDAQQDAYTQPWAINDAGEVSGSSEPQNASHGFVRSPPIRSIRSRRSPRALMTPAPCPALLLPNRGILPGSCGCAMAASLLSIPRCALFGHCRAASTARARSPVLASSRKPAGNTDFSAQPRAKWMYFASAAWIHRPAASIPQALSSASLSHT